MGRSSTNSLQRMGMKEGMESIEQLSLILEGVGKLPESCMIVIQTALEEHTTSIVKSIYPDIHFHSTIRLLSVTSNDISKRNLRPLSGFYEDRCRWWWNSRSG